MCDHFFTEETVGGRTVLCVFDHFIDVTADDKVILVMCDHFFSSQTYQLLFC